MITIEVVQKDNLWWLVVNGQEIGSSKLQCDAALAGKKLNDIIVTGGIRRIAELRSEMARRGAKARSQSMTPQQRTELAKKAADVRWRGQFVATCSTCQQPIYESQAHDRCDDVVFGCGGYFHDECEHTH